mmetsp:Transcript_10471/g.21525  ORF Transcript_10471/g.21525 Transcript_10471/m.21525 type:complete len:100 (-) Transcript_10471:1137-1436(-)
MKHKVVLYDTTYGTNRYRLQLGLVTSIAPSGHTAIIAISLVADQTAETFQWVFRQFAEMIGSEPDVLITDGDRAMAAAAEEEWVRTKHLLCCWHVAKNV